MENKLPPISKEPTIRAFGLETRYWTYHPTYGYGCAECCDGDRCDEDCTAKYKGNRAGCPHCKGKGWIKAEELDTAPLALSKELSEQIEREAKEYKRKLLVHIKNAPDSLTKEIGLRAIEQAADAYEEVVAPWAVKFEQAKKALEQIADSYKPLSPERKKLVTVHCPSIENLEALLASWKEEGKDEFGNWLERCCKP